MDLCYGFSMMRIDGNFTNYTYKNATPKFGDKVLDERNQQLIAQFRERMNSLKENGIPVGDCLYMIPAGRNFNLKTADKKSYAGISAWDADLIVAERDQKLELRKAVVSKDGDVYFTPSEEDYDVKPVKKNSPVVEKVNEFLSEILPKFLQ